MSPPAAAGGNSGLPEELEGRSASFDVEHGALPATTNGAAGGAAEPSNGLSQRHTTTGDSQEELARAGSSVKAGDASDSAGAAAGEEEPLVRPATYREIAKYFGILGWTAFGGPAAHVAMFQKASQAAAAAGGRRCWPACIPGSLVAFFAFWLDHRRAVSALPEMGAAPSLFAPFPVCSCLWTSCGGAPMWCSPNS
jgi:hypothetical protein